MQAQIDEVKTTIGTLRDEIGSKATPADVAAVAQQVAGLESRLAALPADQSAALTSQIAALKTDLDALTRQVTAIPSADEIAALRTDISTLKLNPPSSKPPHVLSEVYFGASSVALSDTELAKVANLAATLKAAPQELTIVGFTDSQGPAELNRSISLRRAAAVRRALVAAGVEPASVTAISGMGEDAPPIDTGDDAEEAGNRVVQIYGHQ